MSATMTLITGRKTLAEKARAMTRYACHACRTKAKADHTATRHSMDPATMYFIGCARLWVQRRRRGRTNARPRAQDPKKTDCRRPTSKGEKFRAFARKKGSMAMDPEPAMSAKNRAALNPSAERFVASIMIAANGFARDQEPRHGRRRAGSSVSGTASSDTPRARAIMMEQNAKLVWSPIAPASAPPVRGPASMPTHSDDSTTPKMRVRSGPELPCVASARLAKTVSRMPYMPPLQLESA
jgi:hypothetical protein